MLAVRLQNLAVAFYAKTWSIGCTDVLLNREFASSEAQSKEGSPLMNHPPTLRKSTEGRTIAVIGVPRASSTLKGAWG